MAQISALSKCIGTGASACTTMRILTYSLTRQSVRHDNGVDIVLSIVFFLCALSLLLLEYLATV